MIPNKFLHAILHSQRNYHTLPVTPFKGTVGVISNESPLVEWLVRFQTVPFKPLTDPH